MCTELDDLSVPLSIRSAVLNIIGLLRIGTLTGRQFLIREGGANLAKIRRLESEFVMLNEELRIDGARMERIDPHRRPHYLAVERMAILELRAMRGWSKVVSERPY